MFRRPWIVLLACAVPFASAALPDAGADGGAPEVSDAGEVQPPDGSAGEGGADRENPEGEDSTGRVPSVCVQSRDCAPEFRCDRGRCVYVGIREADGGLGCGCAATAASPPLWMWACGLVFATRRRVRRVLHSNANFPGIR